MSEELKNFLFRTDRARWSTDEQLVQELDKNGVQVDVDFGVVAIDKVGRNVVLRGLSTDQINQTLLEEYDVEAFVDVPVSPALKE